MKLDFTKSGASTSKLMGRRAREMWRAGLVAPEAVFRSFKYYFGVEIGPADCAELAKQIKKEPQLEQRGACFK